MQAGDRLNVGAIAEGVAELRKVRGLHLANESRELSRLGAKRRARVLVEASASNRLVGKSIDKSEYKRHLRTAVVSIYSPGNDDLCQDSYHGYEVRQGDVILLEAFAEDIGSDAWSKLFGVVRKVPKSSPPRFGRRADTLRAIATGVGLLTVACLTITGKDELELQITCVILLCALFAQKAMSIEEAYDAVNGSVLLTIVGALAIGAALQQVQVANCFAGVVVSFAKPAGKFAILTALYLATFLLGFFVTNAAVVAIMGQIGASIAQDPTIDISVGEVCLVVVYAASACWCTPYGYQTNLMVMKESKYTWGDFIRFGLPLQAVHLIATIGLSPICAKIVFS